MFIFTANVKHANLESLFMPADVPGAWKMICRGSAALAWIETPFIQVCEKRGIVAVRLGSSPHGPAICVFEWQVDLERVSVSRRWSGEFTALILRHPSTVVASHLSILSVACRGLPSGVKSVPPGCLVRLNLRQPQEGKWKSLESFRAAHKMTYQETLDKVRKLVYASVKGLPPSSGLLLSGGLDSSIIAAVARDVGKTLPAFAFSVRERIQERPKYERDLLHARRVAKVLDLPLNEILLAPSQLINNVPLAILLAETSRASIVDPATALIEVAGRISKAGLSSVVTGEAADGLFGSFTFVLRHKKGSDLQKYYRKLLDSALPDEIAVVQRVFAHRGLSLVNPYWTLELKKIGYNIPISYRVDPKRLMKKILRDAFKDLLPDDVIQRPKVVTRNGTQVRFALEARFGVSAHRYRSIFRTIFNEIGRSR
jgi:asparagine synthetase B (glutamine-hydrolysing)